MRALFPFLFLFVTACSAGLTAQSGRTELRKSDQKELAAAQSLLSLQQYPEAREKVDRLLRRYTDVAELYYLDSEIGREQQQYAAALAALDRGLSLEENPPAIAYRKRAELHTQLNDYAAAAADYERYLDRLRADGRNASLVDRATELLATARVAADLAARPLSFSPRPLGPGVNTREHLEYFPSLSVDGQRLIFTRRVGKRQEDFYQSERLPDGTWGTAAPLPGINTPMNEGAQSVTADGSYLVFTGCGRPSGMGSCDLYFSERTAGQWSEAENLGPTVNTRSSESQPSLSPDGKLLFFASNRPGGFGNDDLYVSGRGPDGSWSRPMNLGPTINTSGNDRYPFWAADNRTLYFTSNGRPGMGGADLFKTSVRPDNTWESPVNLGYPINTAGEESNLFIALDGVTAFFSKGVENGIDIYTFDMPEAIRPAPATYVEVTVVDAESDRPLEASVRLQTQDSSGTVVESRTDRTGRYLTVLPVGEDYGFTVEKEGYVFYSDRFELTGLHSADEPYELRIRLQPITETAAAPDAEDDGAIVLRNVFFATGSDALLDLSTEELDRLVTLLAGRPGLRVEIAGHTDDVGSEADNQDLSERRAAAVKAYLEQQGIGADRIQSVGYGESRPVATNATEEGRASNRRTTFRLLF
ncbi:OmpA family protein [Lewinella sp. IMCC34183]|uniref:OmpA family protein n=1 Tax=Lewinella sp. IMCC34183 TaxID=2248762 RepID=UPI000E25618E|nr:OmpA family protein [Lewinella sp. IMCC34183]